jgi:hypothetical protein
VHNAYDRLTDMDFKGQHAGYEAAYGRLAASESAKSDFLTYMVDPKCRSCSHCYIWSCPPSLKKDNEIFSLTTGDYLIANIGGFY